VLVATDQDELGWEWLPDGRSGVFEVIGPDGGKDLHALQVGDPGSRRVLAATPLDEEDAALSPDGRWLAWTAAGAVYVARYPEMTDRVQVAVDAAAARWAHRSHELFFAKNRQVHVVTWQAGPGGFTTGKATALFPIPPGPSDLTYSISADDSRFLFLERDAAKASPEEIRIVEDGFGELARPTGGAAGTR
jgi:hypothetical protein